MTITYRTRRRVHTVGKVLGVLLLAALVIWICWFMWLARFVVYSADGAELRLDKPAAFEGGEVAVPPENITVAIHYNEGTDKVNTSSELGQISGYYASTAMLLSSVEQVDLAIQQLPPGSAVVLDLKSIYGNFYYNTGIPGAPVADALDADQVDRLIHNLVNSDFYLIARIPAFRDRAYGLENTHYGLAVSGGYLWWDEENCYWLNPTSNGSISYLIAIATELRELGFDEVLFHEFRFPDTSEVIINSSLSREEAIAQAAEKVVSSCATEQFAVSFESDNADFPLPEGRSRLYLTGVSAAMAQSVLDASTVPVKESQLVFFTETNDTRFDIASVVRMLTVSD